MNISGSRIIHTVILLCLPFPLICTFLFISKLKAESVSKVKVVSANADTILATINKRSNKNIKEGNKVNQWEALQMLLHIWSYDFYDMDYFIE